MRLKNVPPLATSAFEQWVIDALLHLDECVDKTRDGAKQEIQNLRATMETWMKASDDKDKDLADKWADHVGFHKEGEAAAKARAGVWGQVQGYGNSAFKVATNATVIMAFLYLVRQLL